MQEYHKLYTTFASVLHKIYNHSPSARVCISDTTRPLMLYILLIITSSYSATNEWGKKQTFSNACSVWQKLPNWLIDDFITSCIYWNWQQGDAPSWEKDLQHAVGFSACPPVKAHHERRQVFPFPQERFQILYSRFQSRKLRAKMTIRQSATVSIT